MKLEKCNKNQEDFSCFVRMYTAYIKELSTFSERLKNKEVTLCETAQIWYNPNIEKYFVIEHKTVAGFLLLGVNGNKHQDSDYYVAEFFIVKDKRRQGIGSATIKKLLQAQKGRYCLFVLHKNKAASLFWQKVFADCNYVDVSEKHLCDCTPDDCEFRMYESA